MGLWFIFGAGALLLIGAILQYSKSEDTDFKGTLNASRSAEVEAKRATEVAKTAADNYATLTTKMSDLETKFATMGENCSALVVKSMGEMNSEFVKLKKEYEIMHVRQRSLELGLKGVQRTVTHVHTTQDGKPLEVDVLTRPPPQTAKPPSKAEMLKLKKQIDAVSK